MKTKISRIKVMERIRKEIINIDALAEDIRQNGMLNPVTVMKLPGGELQLLAGLRRLKAATMLGWDEVETNVLSPLDAEASLRVEISENEQREAFTFSEKMAYAQLFEEIERANALARKIEGGLSAGRGRPLTSEKDVDDSPHPIGEKSRDAIGEKIGMSGRQYDRAKHIAENAPDNVLEELDRGERSISGTYNELRAMERDLSDKNDASVKEALPVPVTEDAPVEPPAQAENKPDEQGQDNGDEDDVADGNDDDGSKLENSNPDSAPTKSTPVNAVADIPTTSPKPKPPKPMNPKDVPKGFLSKQDEEAMRKIQAFDAMSPDEKIIELQRQLKEERARAAGAESELARLKELRHNDNLHNNANIENLKMQLKDMGESLKAAEARIMELEAKHGPKD